MIYVKELTLVIRESGENQTGIRIRQPVIFDKFKEYIDTKTFLLEIYDSEENVLSSTKIGLDEIDRFKAALIALRPDKRRKPRLIRAEIITKQE